MEKHHKISIWYFFVGIWIVIILQNYLASTYVVETIPYSQFIQNLKGRKPVEHQAQLLPFQFAKEIQIHHTKHHGVGETAVTDYRGNRMKHKEG